MYANNLGNLDNMSKFLETHTLPKLVQGGQENMNKYLTTSDRNFSHKNVQDHVTSLMNSIKQLMKN